MSHRLKFIVLARLILLGLEPRDALGARPDVELQLLAIDLDLPRFLLERFHARRACHQLRFEIVLLQRQSFYLRFDLFNLLLSILKNEQLFQFRMHGPRSYWRNRMASITTPLIEGSQHLFGSRPDRDIVRQIHPANNAVRINQKFGWPRNIGAFGSTTSMQKVVTPDDFGMRIRKQWISEAHLLTVQPICFHG